jgi:predicted NAD-dependent protein-ADP-ribosyltransferase YbiA (DUF1768 family)
VRVEIKDGVIVLAADDPAEHAEFVRLSRVDGHVFQLRVHGERGGALFDLGPRVDVCREPINIDINVAECWRPISNLAHTPFELHGRAYASVEAFWQGLKFPDEDRRFQIAALHGVEAKQAGRDAPDGETLIYGDKTIPVGRPGHWALMKQACRAKFTQNAEARAALLATGERPLTHRVRRDSETIPGVITADIWTRIRATLRA